ncbi:MAG: hemolysin family protein [Actinomycetota bacterium]|nr:hemolysin family protein [Actinomycetota bacterium]
MTNLINVGIVLLLIVVEGVFVAAEISLVSLRESQVKGMAERSRRGEAVAKLVGDPNRFLAAVQIGVTLTALLSSAYGAVTLSDAAKHAFVEQGLSPRVAGPLGFIGVTLVITYVTLVVGELAPKRLGLQRAEGAAQLFAPSLARIAVIVRPVIWLLSKSTDLVVRLLGGDPGATREAITEDELRGLVAAHESLSTDERKLIDEVFAAGERQVREVMLPRTEVEFLDVGLSVAKAAKLASGSPHSRYPVVRGSQDDVVGFVHVRDLFPHPGGRPGQKVGDLVREVKMLPATKRVLPALSELRREGHHLAIVVDEYGGTAGIVTLEDLIEEVIGDIRDEYDPAAEDAAPLEDGDLYVDGLLNLDEFEERAKVTLPEGPYETVAGAILARLGRLPAQGDEVEISPVRLIVAELDGRRIARVRVTRLPGAELPAQDEPTESAVAPGPLLP